jgi:predicted RNase H-like HicB family nuclease
VFSQGESLEELEENIREVYHLMMEENEGLPSGEIQSKEIGVEV